MKKFSLVVLIVSIFLTSALAQEPSEFNELWKDESRALVIDAYKDNYLDCAKLSREPRVVGIIYRVTQGSGSDAKKYFEMKRKCKDTHNFKWGSFHVGKLGNPERQAQFYIDTAQPGDDEVIALDIEGLGGNNMTLEEATRFIKKIFELTGRYPLLYVMGAVRDEIIRKYEPNNDFAIFEKTPLWYPRYCNNISCYFSPTRPAPVLDKYLFWQFASEQNCRSRKVRRGGTCSAARCPLNTCPLPRPLSGTDGDMDVNVYNGTVEELRNKWGRF